MKTKVKKKNKKKKTKKKKKKKTNKKTDVFFENKQAEVIEPLNSV